jgi:beta propeller repeat protein
MGAARMRCRGWVGALTLGLLIGLGLNAGAARAAGDYSVERILTVERREDQVLPRVSGPWVVWKDYRGQSLRAVDDSPNAQIFAHNVETGEDMEVADSADAGDPAISGTVVVWTAGKGRTTEIRGRDLQGGEIFAVTDSEGRQERPAISGDLIVWQDNRNGNWDLFARDLGQDGDLPIIEQRQDQLNPAVSGRVVVWEDWRDLAAGPDIYGLDLEANRTFRLTTNHDAFAPAISERWVVWVGAADQGVFAQNLDNSKTIRLSKAGGAKSAPAISGSLVVWTDERGDDRDVYGYDLDNATEFVVVRTDGPQDGVGIDGGTVVWSDGRDANRDVVVAKIEWPGSPEPTPTPRPTATSEPTATPELTTVP